MRYLSFFVAVSVLLLFAGCSEHKNPTPPTVDPPVVETPQPVPASPQPLPADPAPAPPPDVALPEQPADPVAAPPAVPEPVLTAKVGDVVSVLYTGTLDDGTVFDASSRHGNKPYPFEVGTRSVIPGFDDGVIGMSVGETKKLHIPAAQAYGAVDPANFVMVPKSAFPPEMQLSPGQRVGMTGPDGHVYNLGILEVGENDVKLDTNHPMAGMDLNFEITMVKIAPGQPAPVLPVLVQPASDQPAPDQSAPDQSAPDQP
ncbi:MAG: FKBP-type peptidyl-prolyl cis-trans isomerase [Planctomycetes bacterium]|nr:FKBP-type peptidyl-prolyl cis-trans isomerase [Planctomycetota bacterium]